MTLVIAFLACKAPKQPLCVAANVRSHKPYLACLRVLGCIEPYIVDVRVCEVVPSGGEANVDLARQVNQLWVALAMISNHVVNGCRDRQAGVVKAGQALTMGAEMEGRIASGASTC